MTSSIDPRAQPAVDAYLKFNNASSEALRKPLALGESYPPNADFTKYSFDPLRAEFETYVASLRQAGVKFRGTPPVPHVKVTSVEPGAKPYPKVTLTDCLIGSDWKGYDRNGKAVPDAPASVPPPYLVTVTMILYKDHWGASSSKADTAQTCTA